MPPRGYGYDDSTHAVDGVDGDASYEPRIENGFYDPRPGHWASTLKGNPHRSPTAPNPSNIEGQDEQQWGQTRVVDIRTTGTGPTGAEVQQLVQATRAARTWNVTLGFSLPGVTSLTPFHAPNSTITVTFILLLGLGATTIRRYVQLFDTDLVTFARDPAFPLRIDTPVASVTLENLPAKMIAVDANIRYDRILAAPNSPADLTVNVTAQVAPVFR